MLLDEPGSDAAGQAHLDQCAACQYDAGHMRRLRMAISALPDELPDPGAWSKIESRLEDSGIISRRHDEGRDSLVTGVISSRWFASRRARSALRIAAAVTLFAGGVWAGLSLPGTPGGAGTLARGNEQGGGDAAESAGKMLTVAPEDRLLFDGFSQLEATLPSGLSPGLYRAGGTSSAAGADVGAANEVADTDWEEAARFLAKLDGSMQALLERLEADPGDPVANAYLIEVQELRDRAIEQLRRAGKISSW